MRKEDTMAKKKRVVRIWKEGECGLVRPLSDAEVDKEIKKKVAEEFVELVGTKAPVYMKERGILRKKRVERATPASMAAACDGDLANALAAGVAGGIEEQERRGQEKTVEEQTIPMRMDTWEALEKLGFKKGAAKDNLFYACTFPDGWKKVPYKDHSMWNHIMDGKGRVRGSFFYKAAFYDQDAFGRMQSRYGVEWRYDGDVKIIEAVDRGVLYDEKSGLAKPKVLQEFQIAEAEKGNYKARDRAENLAFFAAGVWLAERFPGWDDVTIYWD
jgi:hypothetical protein